MNSTQSTAPETPSALSFKNETAARALAAKGETISAIKTLRDANSFLDLTTAKNVVEAWRDGKEISVCGILLSRTAYVLAYHFYHGKLADVPNLDARTKVAMCQAAARENADRTFSGYARELIEMILAAAK